MGEFSKRMMAAAAAAAAMTTAPAYAGVTGVAYNPWKGKEVGHTEYRDALGGDAIKYFIPLNGHTPDCAYGVTKIGWKTCGTYQDRGYGGADLSMYLLFDGLEAGTAYTLKLLFEDLDLKNANDPKHLYESVKIFHGQSGSLIQAIDDINDPNVSGDALTQQIVNLQLGVINAEHYLVRLDFTANSWRYGRNTAEYLIGHLVETPLPAAAPFFVAGLGALGWARRRRRAA